MHRQAISKPQQTNKQPIKQQTNLSKPLNKNHKQPIQNLYREKQQKNKQKPIAYPHTTYAKYTKLIETKTITHIQNHKKIPIPNSKQTIENL